MMKVGLTGGIGSGKTVVGNMFGELGIPVYNADNEAKKLLDSSPETREAIIALLGREAYNGDKANRQFIAGKVFGNETLLGQLNKIVHPAVRQDFKTWFKKKRNAPYVVQEAAILFENGGYKDFDHIILVIAPKDIRLRRIAQRDGAKKEAVEARMAHQWDDEQKLPLADFVIENLELGSTREKVGQIHRKLMELASTGPF